MYRVIIADDEPKVVLLIKNLIRWDELELELAATAHDGIPALAMIEDLQPDIDFIISGYRHFDYAQKAIRFGVEDYLLKPLKAVESATDPDHLAWSGLGHWGQLASRCRQ